MVTDHELDSLWNLSVVAPGDTDAVHLTKSRRRPPTHARGRLAQGHDGGRASCPLECFPGESLRVYGCERDTKEPFQGRSAIFEVHEDDCAAILSGWVPRRGSIGVDPPVGTNPWVQ